MPLIEVLAHPTGHRIYVLHHRHVHHGLTGVLLAAVGLVLPNPLGPVLVGVGAALAYHDWPDRYYWLPDFWRETEHD